MPNATKQLKKLGTLIKKDEMAYKNAMQKDKELAYIKPIYLRLKQYQQMANILLQEL